MPELPEVETIKRGLKKKLIGASIQQIQILNPKTFQSNTDYLEGFKVKNIWRRAKVLGIDLELQSLSGQNEFLLKYSSKDCAKKTLLIHLKMSGQLILQGDDLQNRFMGGHPTKDMGAKMPNKSTRVIFSFSNGLRLYFNDQRKFGWIKVYDTQQVFKDKFFTNLGPEPLEKKFTQEIFRQRLQPHPNLAVKVALLDQKIVAGLGNIYASEALFNAKIAPERKVATLSHKEYAELFFGIIKALEDGIKYGGSTRSHFVNVSGQKGLYLDHAFVYQRAEKKCRNCNTKIKQIKQSGRSTFYCPNCQG